MVLKKAFVAAVSFGVLALAGPAAADEYRPDEFLKLDLSSAVLSPKRLGPETQFAPVGIEAQTDGAQADGDASVWPTPAARKLHVARIHVAKPHVEKPHVEKPSVEPQRAAARPSARAKLARRHGNPLDAQATDTRIQTWPCRTGGICNWQR
jgi:hypothetical protein